jgi:hypothetical protein
VPLRENPAVEWRPRAHAQKKTPVFVFRIADGGEQVRIHVVNRSLLQYRLRETLRELVPVPDFVFPTIEGRARFGWSIHLRAHDPVRQRLSSRRH